jgi:hopene-associated glycosyltransferase HpnB
MVQPGGVHPLIALTLAAASCAVWLYLLVARGQFWRTSERLGHACEPIAGAWPCVVAIVPARDEAHVIDSTLPSLLAQRYAGSFTVVLVDDHSTDGTAEAAREAARRANAAARLTVLNAPPLAPGWTGKLWAIRQGIGHAEATGIEPGYFWLTDADIAYSDDALLSLVSQARSRNSVLTSVMAKLNCKTFVERALIPAFVFFFRMLYPFRRVNDARSSVAAAAGGCMLVKRDALEAAGGIEAIRGELIDDCALARRLKRHGAIWLGESDRVRSLRCYDSLEEARRMISRCAYCQLRYSKLLLAATLLGLSLMYLVPPVLALTATGLAQAAAAAAWALMAVAVLPTLRLYGVAPAWGLLLPAIAFMYLCFTLDSAIQHGRARGGLWKGRAHAVASDGRL